MIKLRNPGWVPVVFITSVTAVLLALGLWQVQRLTWKEALIAQIETQMSQSATASITGDVAYRKATLKGRYIENKALHFVAAKSGGFVHLVPFKLEQGGVLMVSRGWFPKDAVPVFEKNGTVEGVLRPMRTKRRFSPENAPKKNVWFTENLEELEHATGEKLAPYVLETDRIPPLRNDHLGYAITWFTLAIIGLVMFGVYFREKN